jgi:hypothetical protein
MFKAGLVPYLGLAIAAFKLTTFIEHKEVVVVCEESGLVMANYNASLTQPKVNLTLKIGSYLCHN